MSGSPDPKLIDGKETSRRILEELSVEVEEFSRDYRPPHLAVVLVGDDPASKVYVRGKMRSAEASRIRSTQKLSAGRSVKISQLYFSQHLRFLQNS